MSTLIKTDKLPECLKTGDPYIIPGVMPVETAEGLLTTLIPGTEVQWNGLYWVVNSVPRSPKKLTLSEKLGEALFLATQDIFVHFGRAHLYRARTQWENISDEDKEFFTKTAETYQPPPE